MLGAILLFLIVLMYSCAGSDKSGAAAQSSKSPSPAQPQSTPSVLTPETGAPPASEPPAPAPTTAATTASAAPPARDGECTDAEMSVTPVPSQTSAKRGATIDFRLKIKNVSNRTCSRDVGADLQELYVKLGARKIWSSDTCGTAKGSDVQSFTPGFEREYRVSWNGRDTTKCANGLASGPYPDPGEYQLFGRLGNKLSDPVKLTITA